MAVHRPGLPLRLHRVVRRPQWGRLGCCADERGPAEHRHRQPGLRQAARLHAGEARRPIADVYPRDELARAREQMHLIHEGTTRTRRATSVPMARSSGARRRDGAHRRPRQRALPRSTRTTCPRRVTPRRRCAARRQLAEAQRIARMGSFEWDLIEDRVTCSDELYRICGVARPLERPTVEAFLGQVHNEDRPMVVETLERTMPTPAPSRRAGGSCSRAARSATSRAGGRSSPASTASRSGSSACARTSPRRSCASRRSRRRARRRARRARSSPSPRRTTRYRAREPHARARPHRAVARALAARVEHARRAAHRPRPLRRRQQVARPRDRRRGAADARRPPASARAARRHARALRQRRVRCRARAWRRARGDPARRGRARRGRRAARGDRPDAPAVGVHRRRDRGRREHAVATLGADLESATQRAQEQGGGRVAIFDPAMDSRAHARLEAEQDLRRVLPTTA